MTFRTWFITGAGRGFGRIWAEAALARGDQVAATARVPEVLDDLVEKYPNRLLPLPLDITDRQAVFEQVARANEHFGSIDILVSNAGYGLLGAVEEVDFDDVRAMLETNILGTLSVIQAVLPIMRMQRRGHILPISSVGGIIASPMVGMYQATKFAIEGMADTLSQEIAKFGVRVTIVEPGPYATDFAGSSMRQSQNSGLYEDVRESLFKQFTPETFGNPHATVDAIFKVVDADDPPLRLFLGSIALPATRTVYSDRLATWEAWSAVSNASQG